MSHGQATTSRILILLALIAFVQARVTETPHFLEAGPSAGADGRLIAVCTAALPMFVQIEAKPQYPVKSEAANKLLSADGKRGAGLEALPWSRFAPKGGASLSMCQRPLWLLHRVLLI